MHFQASPIGVVISKLKAIKLALKVWDRKVFGNLDSNIKRAYATLIELQIWYDNDSYIKEVLNLESNMHINLHRLLHQ